jgi:NAD(P)-dependent dehydrogenase (short-subunit alcohol dehydrogenase family)
MESEANPRLSRPLSGRGALVTGGGRGIGAAVAEELLARGARVFLCARTATEVADTVARLRAEFGNDAVFGSSTDLEVAESIPLLFEEAERRLGAPIRILVNNAAIGYALPFLETSPDDLRREWDRIQAINIRAPLLLSHELMRRIPRGEKTGSIVNLGSLGGIRGTDKFPGLSLYVATKFAIAGLTEALAVEGRPIGVRVNAVAPGAVDTEMLRKAAPHLKTETRPSQVAKVIGYLCDPSESGAVTGTVIEIHSNL